jgi:hypothetical protein
MIRGDQQISQEPFFQYSPRTWRKGAESNASAASVVAPDDLAAAVNVTLGFGEIEAKRDGSTNFEAFAGLNGEALFVQIEQFAQVDGNAGGTVKTDIDGRMEFLTNLAAPILSGCVAGIQQSFIAEFLFGQSFFGQSLTARS